MEDMTGIIAKIQKLFALANQSKNNSEAEANSAMAKAQELLAKYNLDMAVINDAVQKDAVKKDDAGPREQVRVSRSAMYRWQQEFWKALSELNYCFHWTTVVSEEHPKRKGYFRQVKRHVILGSQVNVAVVQMMGDYLTEVMERELPYPNTERLSGSAISWREGCAQRLIERLQEKAEEMKRGGFKAEDGSNVTALAVVDLHEKEYAANYDARYGAGAYVRMKRNEAEWQERYARHAKEAAEEKARQLGSETPEQREQRQNQEIKEAAKQRARDAAWWNRHQRRQARIDARRDLAAYARGTKKADSVNLDSQVKGR